jgi:hypothetical protein
VVYWCNSYTIVHCSLDIIEWFKYKLKKVFKLYLILIHPPLSINRLQVDAMVQVIGIGWGIKICSNFKVLGLRRNQYHCVHLVFLIPAVYLFSRMESVWRRYRNFIVKSNRSKLVLTVPVRTVRTATWRAVP